LRHDHHLSPKWLHLHAGLAQVHKLMLSALQAGAFQEGWPAVPSNAALECLTALTELQLTVQVFHIKSSNPHSMITQPDKLTCLASRRSKDARNLLV